jgi:hypothetical protein
MTTWIRFRAGDLTRTRHMVASSDVRGGQVAHELMEGVVRREQPSGETGCEVLVTPF